MERFISLLSKRVASLSRDKKFGILLTVDIVLVPIALLVTFALFADAFRGGVVMSSAAFGILLLTVGIAAAGLSVFLGLPRIKLNAYEQNGILRSTVFAIGVGTVAFVVSSALQVGPQLGQAMVVFTMALLILAVGTRIGMRVALIWLYQRGTQRQRVLIYGAGQTGVQLAIALGRDDAVVPVGFVDDNLTLSRIMVAGLPVFAPVRLESVVADLAVDRVVIAIPSISRPKQAQIARRMEELGCDVSVVPSFASLVGEGDLLDRIQSANPSAFLNRASVEADMAGLCNAYRGGTIMITGAGGSIGSELTRQILACSPRKLVLFEISEIALYQLNRELDEIGIRSKTEIVTVLGSVMDAGTVKRTIKLHNVDTILHAAAYKHVGIVERNVLAGMRNNVIGTRVLAEAARDAGVSRFILISTDKAVRPTSMMGASKRLAEMVLQDLATRTGTTFFTIVRFGNVLGSSGSVVPLFEEQIARGGPITLTHPDVTRYFMTLSEAVRLVLLAGNYTQGGDMFVLDMGSPVPIQRLAEQMIESAGYSVRDAANPEGDIEIQIVGLAPGEKLHEELVTPSCELHKTAHPKISRADEVALSQIEIATAMKALMLAIEQGSEDAARAVVARWVGQYRFDGTHLVAAEAP